MTLTIDHIVIYVHDLQQAIENYRNAGFTVNYGGQHADGITENGLIVFSDGSYLELIALVDGKSYADAGFKQLLKETGEGFTGYAFQSDDLEADLAHMTEQGVTVGEIREGQRARPDGEILKWKMAQIDNAMSPFVIQDITDRELRVPLTTENITHDNGARGIHELLIKVPNLEEAIDHYGRIIGTPLIIFGSARFEAGTSAIVITQGYDNNIAPALLTLKTDETESTRHALNNAEFLFV